jgi:hypothetical protein
MPLPGIGEGFFSLTKSTLISAFLALPIVLITVTAFFATSTANPGMMILLLGQILAIPLVQTALSLLRGVGFIQHYLGLGPSIKYENFGELCTLSPVDTENDQLVPPISYWMAHVIFFGTYVLSNAMTIYKTDPEVTNPDPNKVENRKSQMLTAFVLTLVILVFFIYQHYQYVGCDTPGSLFLALALYIPLGYGFFELAKVCGLRTSDLFGIATKLYLPAPGDNQYPYACVNIRSQ